MEQQLTYIGTIHSTLKLLEDCPLLESENAPDATVEILPEFLDGMSNLKPGAQVILFTWLHKGDRKILKTKPRNNPMAEMTGVFSTRSPDRPNPIGIHFATIKSVSANQFTVSAL